MPSAAVLAPIVIPLLAAAVIALSGVAGAPAGRPAAAAGAWGSVAALAAVWIPVRSTLELGLGQLGFGSSFDVRVDAVAFAFGLMVAAPAALLLTLQRRSWQESSMALLALAAAVAAVEAGGVVLTAIAGGTAATLAVVLLDAEDPRAPRPSWAALLAGWLALAWAGVILQVRGGTAVYSAVPVSSVTAPVFALLAASALLASGLYPWRAWIARLWSRPSLGAASVCAAMLYPLGFYLLVRGYELGDGRYPHLAFNVALSLIGAAIALAAAFLAQRAPSRREFFAEVMPAFGGFALMSIAIGTPLGLVAGLVVLATAAAVVAVLGLLVDATGIAPLVAVAAAVGLPPGIAFGSRVLGIESAFEGGDFIGLIGVAGMATWAIWIVASARAIGLPSGPARADHDSFPRAATAIALLTIAAGPALAVLEFAFADPVVVAVMGTGAAPLSARLTDVVTTSTVLPAVALFLPLLVIAALAYPGTKAVPIATEPRPALLEIAAPAWWTRARAVAAAARVPDQYRSLFDPRQLELAAGSARPLLWLAALVALAFAVTR